MLNGVMKSCVLVFVAEIVCLISFMHQISLARNINKAVIVTRLDFEESRKICRVTENCCNECTMPSVLLQRMHFLKIKNRMTNQSVIHIRGGFSSEFIKTEKEVPNTLDTSPWADAQTQKATSVVGVDEKGRQFGNDFQKNKSQQIFPGNSEKQFVTGDVHLMNSEIPFQEHNDAANRTHLKRNCTVNIVPNHLHPDITMLGTRNITRPRRASPFTPSDLPEIAPKRPKPPSDIVCPNNLIRARSKCGCDGHETGRLCPGCPARLLNNSNEGLLAGSLLCHASAYDPYFTGPIAAGQPAVLRWGRMRGSETVEVYSEGGPACPARPLGFFGPVETNLMINLFSTAMKHVSVTVLIIGVVQPDGGEGRPPKKGEADVKLELKVKACNLPSTKPESKTNTNCLSYRAAVVWVVRSLRCGKLSAGVHFCTRRLGHPSPQPCAATAERSEILCWRRTLGVGITAELTATRR